MTAVNLTEDFFTLFGLPLCYELDSVTLADRFRKLQHTVHPDKFANASDLERRLSVQQSARINEAYQILKSPLRRAQYMLELNGIDMSDDSTSVMDSSFLMQQIELRERLEHIKDSEHPVVQLEEMSHEIDAALRELISSITTLFNQSTEEALKTIHDCVRRMQFMSKLQEQVHELEEEYL